MANPKYIQKVGSQLAIIFDDGNKVLAYPTNTKMWLVKKLARGGGGVADPDSVPDITITNCNNESVNITGTRKNWAVGIYNGTQSLNLDDTLKRRAGIAALMTALVESVLRMYANSNVPDSLNYAHDAVGSDHDSLGLMQQRPSAGWGSIAELMDAAYNARAFFGGPTGPNNGSPRGLLDIPDWETGDLGLRCQQVQVSAFPDRYSCWEAGATILYDHIASNTGGDSGTFSFPFPKDQITSYFRTADRPNHMGIDFGRGSSNIPGTPIPAAGSGKVILKAPYYGYGNAVILDHGILNGGPHGGKRLKTLYGHMSDPGGIVNVGDNVTKGQTLGPIGNTGNSLGNHLHWETWVNDVKIDPMKFMSDYGS